MKRVALLVVFVLMISALAACNSYTSNSGTPSATNTSSSDTSSNTITMGAETFSSTSLTISAGSTITFNNDPTSGTEHILVLGTNGQAETEDGAPDFGGSNGTAIQAGKSFTTGAWTKPGTYHVTCIIHPTTMNLTITVTG